MLKIQRALGTLMLSGSILGMTASDATADSNHTISCFKYATPSSAVTNANFAVHFAANGTAISTANVTPLGTGSYTITIPTITTYPPGGDRRLKVRISWPGSTNVTEIVGLMGETSGTTLQVLLK